MLAKTPALWQNNTMHARPPLIDEELLKDTLRLAGRGDLHVFAYGSLMWKPDFAVKSLRAARLHGYSRRLAVRSTHYRGTAKRPGLVFGLDAGGSCCGALLQIAAADKAAVMRYLFEREMFADAYHPRFVRVYLAAKFVPQALAFVVRRDGTRFVPPMEAAAAVRIIRHARGLGGSNKEYILNTYQHLSQQGIHCPQLAELCHLL